MAFECLPFVIMAKCKSPPLSPPRLSPLAAGAASSSGLPPLPTARLRSLVEGHRQRSPPRTLEATFSASTGSSPLQRTIARTVVEDTAGSRLMQWRVRRAQIHGGGSIRISTAPLLSVVSSSAAW
jgi:hypothetical protein